MAVSTNGLAVVLSEHYTGSVSDFEIFQRRKEWHIEELRKIEGENSINDVGKTFELFEGSWGVIFDKRYQGIKKVMRVIQSILKRSLQIVHLTIPRKHTTRKFQATGSFLRMFGRLCGLWTLISAKWRWSESLFE